MMSRKRLAILISGRGSNMMSLVKAAKTDDFPVEVVKVIANRPNAAGLVWARDQGLEAVAIDHTGYATRAEFDQRLHDELIGCGAELVACAGFMRLMTSEFVETWRDRMINIHPSLLPLFRGLHTHRRAIEAGMMVAGCTVHIVRAEVDTGPILGQAVVPVLASDTPETLASRVLRAEHKLYPQILELFASGQITVRGQVVEYPTGSDEGQMLLSPKV